MAAKMFVVSIIFVIGVSSSTAINAFQTLMPEQNKLYSYVIRTNVSTGIQYPSVESSFWTLEGRLSVQVYDDFGRARFKLEDLKSSTSKQHDNSSHQTADAVEYLKKPWEVGVCFTSIHVHAEPVWVTNMKRALSFNFLLSGTTETSEEPCLYGICVVKYSKVGSRTRKYNTAVDYKRNRVSSYEQRCLPNRSSESWYRPVYTENQNFVMTSERVYELGNETGLKSMELSSEFQYRTQYDQILAVTTKLSLNYESDKEVESIQKLNLSEASIQYNSHNYTHPSGDIRNIAQDKLKNKTYETILKIARKGIDADNIVRNPSLIHSLDFIGLLNTMSQLNYTMLRKLFHDVLGTSYELETSRNIFLEVLPYVRSEACAKLIRYLVIEHKTKIEDAALVSLIRKLPFNVVQYSRNLLEELEIFTKLGTDYPQEIRHAGILSFATLVYKTLEVSFDQQYFDDIYDKYLRMYNYCPQYLDRLVWLQGLANIGKSVKYYLDEIHTNTMKNRHERLWAGLAGLSIWKESTFELTLPILMNETEHIQLRIVALHAFLSTPLAARDFMNVHHYIQSCNNEQLKRFWYTTVNSLKDSGYYHRYKSASYYIPFVAKQIPAPDPKHWATNNYIVSRESSLDVQGPTFQLLTVGGSWSGPPEMVVIDFSTGGEQSFNAALYIVAEGVTSNVFKRLQSLNLTRFAGISDNLLNIMKDMKVQIVDPEKVHIDIVIKIYDKTVYATHIDQARFDSWNAEDLKKSIEDFVRFGSHINQQIVYYPVQMVKNFPTELGTPIRLQSTIVSFISLRGNLTAPSTEDLTWRNDLHIRYQGTSLSSLSTDGPLQPSEHTVRIQQSMVVHLPIKFDVSYSPVEKSLVLLWTNPAQSGGIAMHSRTQIKMASEHGKETYTVRTKNRDQDQGGIFFDCERPMSGLQMSQFFTYSFITSLRPSRVITSILGLITSPSGPCGVILPARQLQSGNKLRMEFKLNEATWTDDLMAMQLGYVLDYYSVTPSGGGPLQNDVEDHFLIISGYSRVESDGRNGAVTMVVKMTRPMEKEPKDWTLCFQEKHNISSAAFDIDFTVLPAAAYKGYIAVNVSTSDDFHCFNNVPERKMLMEFDSVPTEEGRNLKVKIGGHNLPKLDLKRSAIGRNNFVNLLESLSENSAEHEHYTHLVIEEENGISTVVVNGSKELELHSELEWIPDGLTTLQLMKKFGFYYECRIKESKVQTFSGATVQLQSQYYQTLAVGDCTDTPRFAVVLSQVDGGLTVNTDRDLIKYFWPKDGRWVGMSSVGLHDVTDISVTNQTNQDILVRSKLTGIFVHHKPNVETVILVPQAYMKTVCGACVGHQYYMNP